MIENIKSLLITALKEKNEPVRDVLRLVVSDIESDYKKKDDDKFAQQVIRTHIKRNKEALEFYTKGQDGYRRLVIQTETLESLLPETMSVGDIEMTLSVAGSPIVQEIQAANNDGQAIGIAMKYLKGMGHSVTGADVKTVVGNLRV